MCWCFIAVVFYLVDSSLPHCLRKKDPPTPTPISDTPSSVEKMTSNTPVEKREVSFSTKEHKKWCGATEESILSMLRFQKERARIRARLEESEEVDNGLVSDDETLVDGQPGMK
jgi:hypothetical protein